jgi:hypothetical protein
LRQFVAIRGDSQLAQKPLILTYFPLFQAFPSGLLLLIVGHDEDDVRPALRLGCISGVQQSVGNEQQNRQECESALHGKGSWCLLRNLEDSL